MKASHFEPDAQNCSRFNLCQCKMTATGDDVTNWQPRMPISAYPIDGRRTQGHAWSLAKEAAVLIGEAAYVPKTEFHCSRGNRWRLSFP